MKSCFGYETYLNIKDRKARKAIACIRSSAHDLRIETGRYVKKDHTPNPSERVCRYCSSKEGTSDFEDLPFFDPIIENESHVMTVCPAYHHLRMRLSDDLKTHLLLHQFEYIMKSVSLAKELGMFLHKSYYFRNPDKTNPKVK